MIDAWIYTTPEAWDTLNKENYTISQAITGFWNDLGIYRVYNLLATKEELDQIAAELGVDLYAIYGWVQGSGYDNIGAYETLPADVLAVMKDNITFDVNGNPTGTTPATYNNPNWGHVFFGQSERIFAGSFNNGFGGGFR